MVSSNQNVDALLQDLRDNPADNSKADEKTLQKIYDELMKVAPTPAGELHWFCFKASATTVAAASFLLRLFGFNGPSAETWRTKLKQCVTTCTFCAESFECVKLSARSTYFGAYPDATLTTFFTAFEDWEVSETLKDLEKVGFTAETTGATLDDAPPPLLYRMLVNWRIFTDKRIQTLLHTCTPTHVVSGWPPRDPPPGLLLLLMDDSQSVREWARMQCPDLTLLQSDKFTPSFTKAFQAMVSAIQGSPSLSISADTTTLWTAFGSAIRVVPVEFLVTSPTQPLDLRHVVTGHLHDTGPHFPDVLKCFILLMKRLSKRFWATNEGVDFPQVLFDSVKDNPQFSVLLEGNLEPWVLAWIPELLHTLQELDIYGTVLVKAVDFLCEELQHERFKDSRPAIMNAGIQLLTSVFRKSEKEKDFRHTSSLRTALDIHGETVVAVAYDRRFAADMWKDTRISARTFVGMVMLCDITSIPATISQTCQALIEIKTNGKANSISPLSIRSPTWKSFYQAVQPKDLAATATITNLVAKIGYISKQLKEPYNGIEKVKAIGNPAVTGEHVLDQVNDALVSVQSGFLSIISNFADFNVSTTALELLSQPDVAKSFVMLLLSPARELQEGAQTMIGLAFDADVRADCFRAMFLNMPEATFDGLIEFLSRFNRYAAQVPEACAAAKAVVRCFNDVLDVLCSSPDGLFLKADFIRSSDSGGPTSRVLELWKLLTTAITIIFKRTVYWATFYKNAEMVEWMRDAIILGRDLIKRWKTFENAANGDISSSSNRLSKVGDKIVSCFQGMLPEMSRWLKLTDEELLYQAFSITQSLLEVFEETKKQPHNQTLLKLTKYVKDAKADKTGSRSRLDAESLMKLEAALQPFVAPESSDDEIEFISHTKAPAKPATTKATTKTSASAKTKVKEEKKLPTHVQQQLLLNKQMSGSKGGTKPMFPHRQKKLDFRSMTAKDDEAKILAASKAPTFRRSAPSVASTASTSTAATSTAKPPATSSADSSSESSSSDDDDDDPAVGLAALTGLPLPNKSPKIRKVERRTIQKLDSPFLGKNPIQERVQQARAQQNTAGRLRPDISELHRTILTWNYAHEGPIPPGQHLDLRNVPVEFSNTAQYFDIFRPLLLVECWAQICRSKEEAPPSFECSIASKQYVSSWIDMDISVTDPLPKDWDLSDVDIVLLSSPDKLKRVMAKTMAFRKSPMGTVATVRCCSSPTDTSLVISTTWQISKIFSLSTINREYGALMSLPHLNYLDKILRPTVAKPPPISSADISHAMTAYQVNKPQAAAILGATSSEGFVLIQGPPGTGKTSTICALVARFMAQRKNPIRQPGKEDPPKAKILICAPSNAAIDEIAQRLKVKYSNPEGRKLNLVRMGNEAAIGATVKPISLDALVRQKIESKTGLQGAPLEDLQKQIKSLVMEMDSLKHLREEKLKELTNIQDHSRSMALEQETQTLRMKRQTLATKLNDLRDKVKSDYRSMDTLRRQMRREVIHEADVVCSTLSGSGHEALIEQEFDMVIIDEAAQAIELSSLIPLKYNSRRCIMVGDPQQLPPTVISQEATRRKYDQSLFLRLFERNPNSIHLLSIQYRMNPEISRFPSQAFYQGRIEDGPKMAELTTRPWHAEPSLGIFKFFNVNGNEETGAFNSLKNRNEVRAAKGLYTRLRRQFGKHGLEGRIGIVSMYRAQVQELRRQFFQEFGQEATDNIDFNTVDGFQGQEKDIIILSCVRAGPNVQRIGFLADVRRLNVAITRAKSSLFILGNVATLERSDETWKSVVADARSRSLIVNFDGSTFTQPQTAASSVSLPHKPPPPKPSRASAAVPPPSQPLPSDLVTPKAYKLSKQTPTSAMAVDPPADLHPDANEPRPNLKRPVDEAPGASSGSASAGSSKPSAPPGGGPPRGPPPKRPKVDKSMAMFIPRKKK